MRRVLAWLLLVVLLLGMALLSLSIGPTGLPFKDGSLLVNIRLPPVILGIVAGGLLAVVGAALQGLLGNVLVDPYTLGVANGAALGTTLGIVLGLASGILVPVLAIIGAVVTLLAVYLLARIGGRVTKTGLVLAGVIVGLFLSGMVMLIMVLSHKSLEQIIYLLMGRIELVLTPGKLWLLLGCGVLALAGLVWLYSYARELNILATNEEVAESLGVNTQRTTTIVFFIGSLLVGMTVAFVGAISFVGLVVPHIARMLFGPDHTRTMPASFLLGGSLLLGADILARLTMPVLPLSVVTAFLGVPFFIYLYRTKLT